MKKSFLVIFLVPAWLLAGACAADSATPLAEAVVYIDHGCADDDSLDQCLRADWIKDQTFNWQWYAGEKQDGKAVSSISRQDLLDALQEIFGDDGFDRKKLGAALPDSQAIVDWLRALMSADQTGLQAQLALDPAKVRVRADPPCREKSVYSCPSRRIEFSASGVAAEKTLATGPAAAAAPDPEAGTAAPAFSAAGQWLPWALLALLAVSVGALGYLVRKLLRQSASQHALLKDLASYTLDSLHNISLSLNADETRDAADIAARINPDKKGLVTDGERLAPVLSDILAPVIRDSVTARLYLSLQDRRFHATRDATAKAEITSQTREHLLDLLPEVGNASTLDDMQAMLEQHEKQQNERKTASEQALRGSVDQLVKDQEELTRQTQLAFNDVQKTIARLDTVVKTHAEKHWFELNRTMPEKLGLLETQLQNLSGRTEQDREELQQSLLQAMQQLEEKLTTNLTGVADSVEAIVRSAGTSLAIADAVKAMKAYQVLETAHDSPEQLAQLECSAVVSMMAGAQRWHDGIQSAQQQLREPVLQDDAISRYCMYVLDSAGLEDMLADFDASFFDRLGLAAAQQDTEAFLRLWGDVKQPSLHTDLFRIRFLLENMLCPLVQERREHPVLTMRDHVVPYCESISASAHMAGIELHRVGPYSDQQICRRFMDPCGDAGKISQAILNSKIEFVEIFREWLKKTGNCETESDSSMVIEICQLGYTLSGKNRPQEMTRVVCYKDIAWQLD